MVFRLSNPGLAKKHLIWAFGLALMAAGMGLASAQEAYRGDFPHTYEPMPKPPVTENPSKVMRVLEAICWYIPNRIVDISDIPRFHVSVGDGIGVSARATRVLTASWFQDDVYCLGWTRRTPPWFTEKIEERYFGFLAAQQGELDRDPTEIGLSAHFLIVGFNLAVSGGEALDALAGFIGVDLTGDDHGPVMFDRVKRDPAEQALQDAVYGPQPESNVPSPNAGNAPQPSPGPPAAPAAPGAPAAPAPSRPAPLPGPPVVPQAY